MMTRRAQSRAAAILLVVGGCFFGTSCPGARGAVNPWADALGPHPHRDLEPPPVFEAKDGPVPLQMEVRDVADLIPGWNLRLRTFRGRAVGPTLRVRPAETLRINLTNHPHLQANDALGDEEEDLGKGKKTKGADAGHNYPNHFGVTNLHTHGLSASPIARPMTFCGRQSTRAAPTPMSSKSRRTTRPVPFGITPTGTVRPRSRFATAWPVP